MEQREREAVEEAIRRGEARWPGLGLTPETFLAHVRLVVSAPEDAVAALSRLHVEDLYLACACAAGIPAALSLLDSEHLARVSDFVSGIDRSPAFVDEVRQRVRERLLVPPRGGGRPRITEYTGRGPLGGWLRVVAVRVALNLRRGTRHSGQAIDEDAVLVASPHPDPELDFLKTRYGEHLQAAFRETLRTLSPEERTLLKLHYIDGLSIDEIGVAYRVHRATAARRIARARDRILAETRRLLAERLGASESEAESLLAIARSQIDLSLRSILRS